MNSPKNEDKPATRITVPELVSTIAFIAISGGLMTILGAGVSGLIASRPHQKDFASRVVLTGAGIGILGIAALNTASLFEPD